MRKIFTVAIAIAIFCVSIYGLVALVSSCQNENEVLAKSLKRNITTCTIVPCDEPAHFLFSDYQMIQLQPIREVVKIMPEKEKGKINEWAVNYNEHTLVIAMNTLDWQKWNDASYILASFQYIGYPLINAINISLIEDWLPDACKIGDGIQKMALFNQYILWWRGEETWPSKEECEAKIGKIR